MRFLLVEDSAGVCPSGAGSVWALTDTRSTGLRISQTARDCLAAADYDMILLDITLPDGDGRELLLSATRRSDG